MGYIPSIISLSLSCRSWVRAGHWGSSLTVRFVMQGKHISQFPPPGHIDWFRPMSFKKTLLGIWGMKSLIRWGIPFVDKCEEEGSLGVTGCHLVTLRWASLEIKNNHRRHTGENEINRIFGDITELKEACWAPGFSVEASQYIPLIIQVSLRCCWNWLLSNSYVASNSFSQLKVNWGSLSWKVNSREDKCCLFPQLLL